MMLHLQSTWPFGEAILAGKRTRDVCQGQQASPLSVSPKNTIVVATIKSHKASIFGKVGGISTEIMLNSGSSVSLLSQDTAQKLTGTRPQKIPSVQLQTASGESLPIIDYVSVAVQLNKMESVVYHDFIIVPKLIAPVILRIDFFQQHNFILDFTEQTIQVYPKQEKVPDDVHMIWDNMVQQKPHVRPIAAVGEMTTEITNDCAIPDYGAPKQYKLPNCSNTLLSTVVDKFKDLFCTTPGHTSVSSHHIPTKGSPIRVPPRCVPAHYRNEVERQINQMLIQGIISKSSNPWMAPAVFVPKKSGELHICIDYRQLNKQTVRDAYTLPLPDEIQDHLAGSSVFTTLDLQSGYWQLLVAPEDQAKTAFCPGPGMGLYQFHCMPLVLQAPQDHFSV